MEKEQRAPTPLALLTPLTASCSIYRRATDTVTTRPSPPLRRDLLEVPPLALVLVLPLVVVLVARGLTQGRRGFGAAASRGGFVAGVTARTGEGGLEGVITLS